jgi:hypothetical protein
MRRIMWAEVFVCRSPLETRLRSPFKSPLPDLLQALQRADMPLPGPRDPCTAKFDDDLAITRNELFRLKLLRTSLLEHQIRRAKPLFAAGDEFTVGNVKCHIERSVTRGAQPTLVTKISRPSTLVSLTVTTSASAMLNLSSLPERACLPAPAACLGRRGHMQYCCKLLRTAD